MKRLLIPLLALLTFPNFVNSSHLNNQKELIVNSESTRESIELAKHLKDNGVVKYSAYWCPNCLNQSELFGKQAYKELNVVECARDGINSQTQLCIDKNIKRKEYKKIGQNSIGIIMKILKLFQMKQSWIQFFWEKLCLII